jgi:hypothetical protein
LTAVPLAAAPWGDETGRSRRNRRTAAWLVAWIVLLMAVSIAVIWVKN